MQTRIYKVTCSLEGHTSPRLVEATSVSAAIRHCTGGAFAAKTVNPKEVVELMKNGVAVETAIADKGEDTTERGVHL